MAIQNSGSAYNAVLSDISYHPLHWTVEQRSLKGRRETELLKSGLVCKACKQFLST